MEQPQFGQAEPGFDYKDRFCAYGVAPRFGRIAVVHVGLPGEEQHYHLPGGALDPGEDAASALIREFGEETGLMVRAGPVIAYAGQYVVKKGGKRVNNRSTLILTEIAGRKPELKIEDDHRLVWLRPEEALRRLRRASHAWAVACWMRAGG